MSAAAFHAVFRYSQAPNTTHLCILAAMADWADDNGYCFPSYKTIANKTGASIATVKRAIRHAVTVTHEVEVNPRGHQAPHPREFVGRTGFKATHLYRITLVDKLGTAAPAPVELARNHRAKKPRTRNRGHGDHRSTANYGQSDHSSTCDATPATGVTERANCGHPKAEQGSGAIAELWSPTTSTLLMYTEDQYTKEKGYEDLDLGTSELKAAAPPRNAGEQTTNDKNRNAGVITKIAHEALDFYARTDAARDATSEDVKDWVREKCRELKIPPPDPDVVNGAIESALYQRRHAGKPPLFPSSSGEAAFRCARQDRATSSDRGGTAQPTNRSHATRERDRVVDRVLSDPIARAAFDRQIRENRRGPLDVSPCSGPASRDPAADTDIWRRTLARIERDVNRHTFYTWFRHTKLVSDHIDVVEVARSGDSNNNSEIVAERLPQYLADVVQAAINAERPGARVEFVLVPPPSYGCEQSA
jgi:hypothetical protein